MLEHYFKTKQDFDNYLDETYDPDAFEKSFDKFLNSLVSSSGDCKIACVRMNDSLN